MISDKKYHVIFEKYNGNFIDSPNKSFIEDIIELISKDIRIHRIPVESEEACKTLSFSYDSSNHKFLIKYYIGDKLDTDSSVSKDELMDMVYSFINT